MALDSNYLRLAWGKSSDFCNPLKSSKKAKTIQIFAGRPGLWSRRGYWYGVAGWQRGLHGGFAWGILCAGEYLDMEADADATPTVKLLDSPRTRQQWRGLGASERDLGGASWHGALHRNRFWPSAEAKIQRGEGGMS